MVVILLVVVLLTPDITSYSVGQDPLIVWLTVTWDNMDHLYMNNTTVKLVTMERHYI